MPTQNSKFVMVASGKGGVGKTTTTVHLAYLLDGVIIDLDPKKSTRYFKGLRSPVLDLKDPIPEGKNVVIDAPPSAELVEQYARKYRELLTHVVIPLQPTAEDYALARHLYGIFSGIPGLKVGVLLNFLGPDRDSKLAPAIVKEDFGWNLVGEISYRPAVFRNVRTSGLSLDSVDCYVPASVWVNA